MNYNLTVLTEGMRKLYEYFRRDGAPSDFKIILQFPTYTDQCKALAKVMRDISVIDISGQMNAWLDGGAASQFVLGGQTIELAPPPTTTKAYEAQIRELEERIANLKAAVRNA